MVEENLKTDNADTKINRKSLKKWLMVVLIGVAVLAIATAVFGILTNRLAVVFKNPEQRVIVVTNVCGDDIINKYNDAITKTSVGDNSGFVAIDALINNFTKNPDYQRDPNCLFIKFQLTFHQANFEQAKQSYDKIADLANDGIFVSSKINGAAGLDGLKRALDFLELANDRNSNTTQDLNE